MQPIPVVNFGAFSGPSAPRPRLGQQEIALTEAKTNQILQDNAYVQGLKVGEQQANVAPQERKDALRGFISSTNDLEEWKDDLDEEAKVLTPTVFNAADLVIRKAKAELEWLATYVWGKTGNPDAEKELGNKWKKLSAEAARKIANPPDWFETLANAFQEFINFLIEVAKETWVEFVKWAEVASKPVLRRYYNAAIRLIDLKNDLAKAKKDGGFSEATIRDQETDIADADSLMDIVRTTFATLTGGNSLDDYVQIEWGDYPKLELGAAVGWPLLAITGAAMAGIIIVAVGFVNSIDYLAKEFPGLLVLGIVALGAAIALPVILRE